MATGRTAEGTIWTTRPLTPAIEASYTCHHHGGTRPCSLGDTPEFHCQDVKTWLGGEGSKRYSPATPKGTIRPLLPPSVGEGFQEGHARAIRRLNGLEPWPALKPDKAPKLSELSRRLADPVFIKIYKAFCASVVASGGQLAMPFGTGVVWRNPYENNLPVRRAPARRKVAVAA